MDIDLNALRIVVMLISLVLFLAVVGWVYARSRREAFEEAGRLVLDDDQPADGGKQ